MFQKEGEIEMAIIKLASIKVPEKTPTIETKHRNLKKFKNKEHCPTSRQTCQNKRPARNPLHDDRIVSRAMKSIQFQTARSD